MRLLRPETPKRWEPTELVMGQN